MFGLRCFPLIFLFMKSKGANFGWVCLITLSNRFYKNFLPKKVSFSWKTEKLDSFVLPEWENKRTHIENILLILSRGSVAHHFNLLHNVRYRTTKRTAPNRRQWFKSSCNQSGFNFFSLLGPNVLVLFSHLLIFFILRGLLYLTLL